MKVLKRRIFERKANQLTELLFLDCNVTIIFVTRIFDNIAKGMIYHCTGFDEVGNFKYNTDGISVGERDSKKLSKDHHELIENFWRKMQDEKRYEWTINVLIDNYYDYRRHESNIA